MVQWQSIRIWQALMTPNWVHDLVAQKRVGRWAMHWHTSWQCKLPCVILANGIMSCYLSDSANWAFCNVLCWEQYATGHLPRSCRMSLCSGPVLMALRPGPSLSLWPGVPNSGTCSFAMRRLPGSAKRDWRAVAASHNLAIIIICRWHELDALLMVTAGWLDLCQRQLRNAPSAQNT